MNEEKHIDRLFSERAEQARQSAPDEVWKGISEQLDKRRKSGHKTHFLEGRPWLKIAAGICMILVSIPLLNFYRNTGLNTSSSVSTLHFDVGAEVETTTDQLYGMYRIKDYRSWHQKVLNKRSEKH